MNWPRWLGSNYPFPIDEDTNRLIGSKFQLLGLHLTPRTLRTLFLWKNKTATSWKLPCCHWSGWDWALVLPTPSQSASFRASSRCYVYCSMVDGGYLPYTGITSWYNRDDKIVLLNSTTYEIEIDKPIVNCATPLLNTAIGEIWIKVPIVSCVHYEKVYYKVLWWHQRFRDRLPRWVNQFGLLFQNLSGDFYFSYKFSEWRVRRTAEILEK
jgi:hypothetical protein